LPKHIGASLTFRNVLGIQHQHADAPHALGLLCVRRQRPRRRAAKQRDELSSSEIEHGLPLGTRCASLPHAEVAPEVPAGPWGRSESF
jgi:hypothetical protein